MKAIVSIVLVFFLTNLKAQTHPELMEHKSMFGKIKSIISLKYEAKSYEAKIEKTGRIIPPGALKTFYNDKMQLTKFICDYNNNETNISEGVFIYKNDLLVKSTERSWVQETFSNYTFDTVNEILVKNSENGYTLLTKFKNSNIIEEEYFNPKKELIRKVSYEYDEKNRLIKVSTDEPNESFFILKVNYNYIDKENKLEIETTFNNGDLKKEIFKDFKYDQKGNWIERINFDNYNQAVYIEIRSIIYY